MSAAWATVIGAGVTTVLLKATGPVLLGGRALAPRVASVVELLAPAVLAALVVTQAVGDGEDVVLDARLVGLVAAAVAIRARAPLLAVIAVAALAAAASRAL